MSVILNLSVSTEQPKCFDEKKLEMKRNQTNHHANDRTNHRSFLKFHGTVKIPRQRANSAARLEIPQLAENCGP